MHDPRSISRLQCITIFNNYSQTFARSTVQYEVEMVGFDAFRYTMLYVAYVSLCYNVRANVDPRMSSCRVCVFNVYRLYQFIPR